MRSKVKVLRRLIIGLEQHQAWRALGYPSESLMMLTECDLSMDEVEAVKTARDDDDLGTVLGKHGGDRRSAQAKEVQGSDRTLKSRGETADYLAARLDRDFPAIAARLRAGEFNSVRAAALEAKLVRPQARIYTDDPKAAARVIRKHFKGDSLLALIAALQCHE